MWSDLDQLMVPKRNARLAHPDLESRNILVRGVGHMSLPIHRHTVHEITLMLAQLDPAGSTVTAGVTPINTSAGSWAPGPGPARGSPGPDSPGRASG